MPAEVLLGGDQPWLRRLLGISVAPQVGSIFNEAVRDNTAKQWNGIAVGLRTLLRTLYSPIPFVPRPSCRPVAAAFREHCCGESGSHYLLFLEEDCDAMLESADACGVGLAAVSGDVVESVNYILKKGYNGHGSPAGLGMVVSNL